MDKTLGVSCRVQRFVRSSTNHALKRFAAGTLHNTMESLQQAFLAQSMDNRASGGTHGLGASARLHTAPGTLHPAPKHLGTRHPGAGLCGTKIGCTHHLIPYSIR